MDFDAFTKSPSTLDNSSKPYNGPPVKAAIFNWRFLENPAANLAIAFCILYNTDRRSGGCLRYLTTFLWKAVHHPACMPSSEKKAYTHLALLSNASRLSTTDY